MTCPSGTRRLGGLPLCIDATKVSKGDYQRDTPDSEKTKPVAYVSWQEAKFYCFIQGGNLPTGEQWDAGVGEGIIDSADPVSEWVLDVQHKYFRKFRGRAPQGRGLARLFSGGNGYSLPHFSLSNVGFRCVFPESKEK